MSTCRQCAIHYGGDGLYGLCDEGKPLNSPHRIPSLTREWKTEVLLSLFAQSVELFAKPIPDIRSFAIGWALGKGQNAVNAEEFADAAMGVRRLL